MKIKSIAVLTSGGDAPGMNAAVRAVARSGIANGMRIIGVKRGYNGLINGDVFEMNLRSVSDILHRGGTMLFTARSPEFKTPEGVKKAVDTCHSLAIDGVVVIGGDGSFKGARDLTAAGVPCVCIPGTIDNDIACSEYTIGFDTAMNTAMRMVDKIRDTAQSHDRCSVVELMGRRCGDIALQTGIAVGATDILVPETNFYYGKNNQPGTNHILDKTDREIEKSFPPFPREFKEKIDYINEIDHRTDQDIPVEGEEEYKGKHFNF